MSFARPLPSRPRFLRPDVLPPRTRTSRVRSGPRLQREPPLDAAGDARDPGHGGADGGLSRSTRNRRVRAGRRRRLVDRPQRPDQPRSSPRQISRPRRRSRRDQHLLLYAYASSLRNLPRRLRRRERLRGPGRESQGQCHRGVGDEHGGAANSHDGGGLARRPRRAGRRRVPHASSPRSHHGAARPSTYDTDLMSVRERCAPRAS